MQVQQAINMDFRQDFIVGSLKTCGCGKDYTVKARNQLRCSDCAGVKRLDASRKYKQNKAKK